MENEIKTYQVVHSCDDCDDFVLATSKEDALFQFNYVNRHTRYKATIDDVKLLNNFI